MDKGWIGIKQHPIAAGDGPVIVWHVYSGVMVEQRDRAKSNRFMTHWREIDETAWIDVQQYIPTKADADIYDCVISLNKWGEPGMAGWHRFEHESDLIGWQPTPDPPADYRELRNAVR